MGQYAGVKYEILEQVRSIRDSIGASRREPEITRVWESAGTIRVECEDRADKSIIIGTGGWVAGKLSLALGGTPVTVSSRLDTILSTRRLVRSRRAILNIGDKEVRSVLLGMLLKSSFVPLPSLVLGEECLWMCGMAEPFRLEPCLLHTGFVDPRVQEAYGGTTFVSVQAPATPYEGRLEALLECAKEHCKARGVRLVFGPFDAALGQEEDITLVNPGKLFFLSQWEKTSYEKKRYRASLVNVSDENRADPVRRTLNEAWEGQCEPSVAAREIYTHWPKNGMSMDEDGPQPDEYVRTYRRKNAIRRAQELSIRLAVALSSYGERRVADSGLTALVAWSGGVDSTASITVCKSIGITPDAATVAMPHIDLGKMQARADELGVRLTVLPVPAELADVSERAAHGNIHPCGRCHAAIEETVRSYAKENGYDLVVYGDMLSVGAQSVVSDDGICILNLPAALMLTKRDMEQHAGQRASTTFGCPLLSSTHELHPHTRRVSIQRVMRELRGQVITPAYACLLIGDIMRGTPDDNVYID